MGKHLHEIMLNGKLISESPATLERLKSLMKNELVLDAEILKEFPINHDQLTDPLWILGSDRLIGDFLSIDNHKLDIPEVLKNISINKVTDRRQLLLTFTTDKLQAEGVYKFTNDYLDRLFKMGKFSKYCMDNNYDELLVSFTKELCSLNPNKKLQYRLIKDKETKNYLIRGVTSIRYNNYDNHLALYLTLLSLHNHAVKSSHLFELNKAYLSDSEIVVMFDQIKPINIIGIGKLYLGCILTNNEVREKSFTLEYRFRLEDNEGCEFGAIPSGEEPIFTIRHDSSISTVRSKLLGLQSLQTFEHRIINLILFIAESPYLSEDRIFKIFKTIGGSRTKFSFETKQSFNELKEQQIINNSLHIIKAFNRMNELVTDVEERIHLERIFFDVCMEVKRTMKKG